MRLRYQAQKGDYARSLLLIRNITEAEGWDWRSAKKEIARIVDDTLLSQDDLDRLETEDRA